MMVAHLTNAAQGEMSHLGIFGTDVATTKEIIDGEGSITLVNQWK